MAVTGTVAGDQTYTVSGPGANAGETLSASATFTISNLDLVVTLSNTSTSDPVNANDILTAFFFKLEGDLQLTPVSAEVAPGSSVVGHKLPLGFTGDVGSQWAYRNDLVGLTNGVNEGISSETLKWFGTKNLFSSQKIKGFGSFGSIAFGLTTDDDFPSNDQGNIKNQGLIQNAVVFTFSGLPRDFALSDISYVTFQYGPNLKTRAEELMANNVPEPSTVGLVALGMLGVLAVSRRALARKSDSAY
ncbi:MAG TPA: PEP-CTERM sorting domain-containing protein [Verrucomicrobiae bacterium]|nr:PEP-CTERM sorting domain-containing protein [Verrucomicrobiae bacterium]